jgi:protein-S-isoprenylcysteine O-methyltransferase Ste14
MQALELKLPPLVVWLLSALAVAAAARLWPGASMPFAGHRAAAVVVLLLGIMLAIAGVVQFRRARTTVNPLAPLSASAIVDSGVYRLSRNPMYLGMALGLGGLALWWANVAGGALVLLFCWYLTRFQIKPEERALLARFGSPYAAYLRRVRRWL